MEPGQMVQETYTVEEDPQELPPVVSVETGEDGTTRRTETTVTRKSVQISARIIATGAFQIHSCLGSASFICHCQVKKMVKTTTTRSVIPSVSDTLSLDGGASMTGVGGYTTPMVYRQGPGGGVPMDYPTHTVPRNYHYGPPAGYSDYRTGPPSEIYTSLTRGAHMDDCYR